MEQAYWLRRTRAASRMAQRAMSAEARLAHLELAGRYSIKAAAASRRSERATVPPQRQLRAAMGETEVAATFGGAAYYDRLEMGARWMASQAQGAIEWDGHIAAANRYARLRNDAAATNGGDA